jgi:predicted Zn finger-like uncharacterized protein
MNLVTRCPACGTAFRVQRDQLAAHFGTVRCGKCGSAFNGVAALVEEGAEKLALEPSPQLGLFDPSRRQPPAHIALEAGPAPEFLTERPPARRLGWLWAFLSLAAAAGLAAQAYRWRAEITMAVPQLRPAFEAICEGAGCSMPLPRDLALMSIVSSDMHQDPQREGVVVFHALLRNSARFAQPFPVLQLTLTQDGKPVARRLLRPGDSAIAPGSTRQLAQGIAAGGEESLRIHLDSRVVRANGYRACLYPRQCIEANE